MHHASRARAHARTSYRPCAVAHAGLVRCAYPTPCVVFVRLTGVCDSRRGFGRGQPQHSGRTAPPSGGVWCTTIPMVCTTTLMVPGLYNTYEARATDQSGHETTDQR